jgi:acyl-CoA thioester hydrolase
MLLQEFAVVVDIDVRFRDMDAFAHVDNIVYYEYFEIARVAYLDRIGMPIPGPAWHDFGWVIGSTCCRYKAAVVYPDILYVGARVGALSDDRVLMEYRVVSKKLDRVAVEGEALLVAYDFDAGRAVSIREDIRNAILRLEDRKLPKVPRSVGRMVF